MHQDIDKVCGYLIGIAIRENAKENGHRASFLKGFIFGLKFLLDTHKCKECEKCQAPR